MGNSCKMQPPYYILINDKDFEHLKFYHDYNFKNIHYENEFGDHSAETAEKFRKFVEGFRTNLKAFSGYAEIDVDEWGNPIC